MGKSAAQVRREIEETREGLGEDLEELGERVSPKRIVQRRTARVWDGLHSVRESVMGAASTDGDGVAASAKDKAGSVAEQAKGAPDRMKAETQGNPLVAGVLAFGAGFLLGSVVPPSEPEQEAAQNLKEKLEPAQQRATQIGKGVASDLQESAQESLEKVKGRATDAAEKVKGEAQGSAETVKRQAKGASEQVQRQAKSASRQVKGTAKSSAKRATGGAKRPSSRSTTPSTRARRGRAA